jgi:DNA replication protein DnaC
MNSVMNNKPKIFFLNGPGGTGKTHVYNTLCYALHAEGIIVLCVASSGIAALLLLGGRTSHSTFKIPITLWEGILCNVKKGTMLAELFKKVRLIIWDEVPMQDRRAPEAVDKTMQDI